MTTAVSTYTVPKEIEKKILTAIELKKELKKYEEEIKDIKDIVKEILGQI